MADEDILKVVNVNKSLRFGDEPLHILRDVNFSLVKGETLAIQGRSGSGKTTLLGILAGLDVSTDGEVWLQGKNLSSMTEDQRAHHRAQSVGFIFQSFQLLPSLTALENVMLPLELKGHSAPSAQAEYFLKQVGLADRLTHYPPQLSGGEQQRVAIARAFASKPELLFADEPTGNLDGATGQQIINLLFDMNTQTNTTLVMVTHDPELAARCHKQYLLIDGVLTAGLLTDSRSNLKASIGNGDH